MPDQQRNNPPSTFNGFPPSGSMLCPRCDYDLCGLPVCRQCPKCGLVINDLIYVWRKPLRFQYSTRRNTILYLIGFSFLVFFMHLLDATRPLIRPGDQSSLILAILVAYTMLFITLISAIMIASLSGKTFAKGPFVGITNEKLFLKRSRFEATNEIDWQNITEVFITTAFASLVITERQGKRESQYALLDFFPTYQQLKSFCDLVDAHLPDRAMFFRSPTRYERLAYKRKVVRSTTPNAHKNTKAKQVKRHLRKIDLRALRELRLNECPNCSYRLRVRTLQQRCPECGLMYDDKSISWMCARAQDLGLLEVLQFLIVIGVPLSIMSIIESRGFSALTHPAVITAIALNVGIILINAGKGRIQFAMLPGGLWRRRGTNTPEQIEYTNLLFASVCTQRGNFRLNVWCNADGHRKKICLYCGPQSIGTAILESLSAYNSKLEIRLCP